MAVAHPRRARRCGIEYQLNLEARKMSTIIRLPIDLPAHVIGEDQVSPARLQSPLEAAVIEVELEDDDDLYATDGLEFPTWVRILEEEQLIMFSRILSLRRQMQTAKIGCLA
jgi:hypothetical protein